MPTIRRLRSSLGLACLFVLSACAAGHTWRARPRAPGALDTFQMSFDYRMGPAYQFDLVTFWVDGEELYSSTELGMLERIALKPRLADGEHTLLIALRLEGMGVLDGVDFRVCRRHTFRTWSSGLLDLKVISYEKGDPAVGHEGPPAIRYEQAFLRGQAAAETTAASTELSEPETKLCRQTLKRPFYQFRWSKFALLRPLTTTRSLIAGL